MEIIKTGLLTKKYGDLKAVDNVSIHVKQGEIYGFLGLNGAGKTTTIRMLLGMIKPTSGEFKLFGQEISSLKNNWNDVGYLVESAYSYPNLSVKENLKVYAKLRGLNKTSVDEIIENLRLTKYKDIPAKNLSLGNQQRLGIAKALIHLPKLLILDEPINGLDPQGIVEVRELLLKLAKEGTTIFLSSHILSEISKLVTRIGIIHQGSLIRELFTAELGKQLIHKIIIDLPDHESAIDILHKDGYKVVSFDKKNIEVLDQKALDRPEDVNRLLVKNNLSPRQIYKYEEDLEHYFLRIIGKETVN